MHARWLMLGLLVGATTLPAGATAAVGAGTFDPIALPAAANSAALGPDGAVWVTLPTLKTVARVAPDGTVTQTPDLGGTPSGIAAVDGRIWATVTTAKKVAIIDPANPSAAPAFAPTPAGSCGPVAVADGGNGNGFVSLPNDGSPGCGATPSAVVQISASGVAGTAVTGRGTAFDLIASNGSLWIPDFDGDVVRRTDLSAALTLQATYGAPAGSSPDGIGLAPDGQIVTSLYSAGALAKVSPSAPSTSQLAIFGAPMGLPFGLTSVGGSLYAAEDGVGGVSGLRRFPADGSMVPPLVISLADDPFDLAPGPDGDVYITDRGKALLVRYTSRPPRVRTGPPLVKSEFAQVGLSVNPGGNQATTSVEYGPTTAYGATAASEPLSPPSPGAVPIGIQDVTVRTILPSLKPGTTYHYRAIATTPEGTAVGEDRTFTTLPAAKVVTPLLTATVSMSAKLKKGLTRITRIRVTKLVGGETIKVTCGGKGCPKKGKSVKVLVKKAGALNVSAPKITKAQLAKGAVITVQITKAGNVGIVTTATTKKTAKPKVKTLCLQPGATKAAAC